MAARARSPRSALAHLVAAAALFVLRTRASGTEGLARAHESAGGKVLVTANHVSFLDGVLIALSSPIPMLYAVEAEYAVRNFFTRTILTTLSRLGFGEVAPLDPTSRYGIRRLRHALMDGRAVMIFPEGRIGTGHPQPSMPGFRWLLEGTGAVEFRVQIRGAENSRFFGKAGHRFWPPIELIYGDTD